MEDAPTPKLVRRRQNRKSTFKLGRTIGAKREKLETANERAAARKKDRQKTSLRIVTTVVGFAIFAVILVVLFKNLTKNEPSAVNSDTVVDYPPTIEIIDEAASTGSKITSRMLQYIGRAEKDFRDLGLKPTKAVFPSSAIREVDFYLEGYSGYIKLTIDRDSAVSAEDAERMLRYLLDKGITEFTYIDVRTEGKAYWK